MKITEITVSFDYSPLRSLTFRVFNLKVILYELFIISLHLDPFLAFSRQRSFFLNFHFAALSRAFPRLDIVINDCELVYFNLWVKRVETVFSTWTVTTFLFLLFLWWGETFTSLYVLIPTLLITFPCFLFVH